MKTDVIERLPKLSRREREREEPLTVFSGFDTGRYSKPSPPNREDNFVPPLHHLNLDLTPPVSAAESRQHPKPGQNYSLGRIPCSAAVSRGEYEHAGTRSGRERERESEERERGNLVGF